MLHKENKFSYNTIHESFEAMVHATPNAIAIIDHDEQMTYAELNQSANQLAHYIRLKYTNTYHATLAPNTLIGLCIERGTLLIVAILAVLKAGAAYVPLDPSYPEKRLRFIAEDCNMSLCIKASNDHFPNLTDCVINLAEKKDEINTQSTDNLVHFTNSSHLAYTIYTSGTTGNPKGVMVAHAGVCNMLHWGIKYFPITPQDRILQVISSMFDVSVWEIGSALLAGASLVLTAPIFYKDPKYLIEIIIKNSVTVIGTVPSLLKSLIAQKNFKETTCLKHILCCAEPLTLDLCRQLFQILDVNLYNGYGPTEASIICTYIRYTKNTLPKTISIGEAIQNVQLLVLDNNQHLVAEREIGELYIGGIGIAVGYLNRDQLNQEKFVSLSTLETPTRRYDRYYKTGDLVRWLDHQSLEFIGRSDDQIKLRGFRIELKEIEAHLHQCPGITDCIVVVKMLQEQPYLVAYCILEPEADFCIQTLRRSLRKMLPEYMIPTYFVKIESFPLNDNGKTDKNALPLPNMQSRY